MERYSKSFERGIQYVATGGEIRTVCSRGVRGTEGDTVRRVADRVRQRGIGRCSKTQRWRDGETVKGREHRMERCRER